MAPDSFAAAASLAASAMLVRSIARDIIPPELRAYVFSGVHYIRSLLSSHLTLIIPERESLTPNQIFSAARTYLATKIPPSAQRLRVSKKEEEKTMGVSVEPGEEIVDAFQGIQFKWALVSRDMGKNKNRHHEHGQAPAMNELLSFELSFHKKHRGTALGAYLPFILDQAKAIDQEGKAVKLYMNVMGRWMPVNFHHPATFDTMAMDPDLKRSVMEDLARFVKRRGYYKKIGKAWKRGYLLYGPPGTGKSSLIAAMANFLKFDIYNMELSDVRCNSSLQMLLMGTTNRSILVIEDIDCTIDLQVREAPADREIQKSKCSLDFKKEKITLSGLLNFVDGLWSSCGEERIIVFTTNYKDRIDPALLRPGRMDMHIHMGYCGSDGFRVLASNYHGLDEHHLFGEIEELIGEVEASPAEVAEELMRSDDAEVALGGLIDLLRGKREKVGVKRRHAGEAESDGGRSTRQQRGHLGYLNGFDPEM